MLRTFCIIHRKGVFAYSVPQLLYNTRNSIPGVMSKQPPPAAPGGALDFEDGGYDGPETEQHDMLQESLANILSMADARCNDIDSSRQATRDAVSSALESALFGVEMLFIERDAISILPASIANGSWEPEAAPVPPTADSWLRAAIPETASSRTSFAMYQFLRQPAAATTLKGSTATPKGSRPGSGTATKPPVSPARQQQQHGGSGVPSPMRQASPDVKRSEDRLREELKVCRGEGRGADRQVKQGRCVHGGVFR